MERLIDEHGMTGLSRARVPADVRRETSAGADQVFEDMFVSQTYRPGHGRPNATPAR
uniref:hypothetical protein n=1 Tax=Saccharothrix mutabilis TaxID=33921 RepID=UPI0031D9108E